MTDQRNLLDFDGETYERKFDSKRLSGQLSRVFRVMEDGQWRTLAEIGEITGDGKSLQSISARLRDLRKERFGKHEVKRRRRGDPHLGLHEYCLIVRKEYRCERNWSGYDATDAR